MRRETIEQYLDSRRLAWSESTARSERYRLLAVAELITGKPDALWAGIEHTMSPYTRVTLWTRVTAFWDWAMETGMEPHGPNPYRSFRLQYARQFKNVYRKKMPTITFDEAKRRVGSDRDTAFKRKAFELLHSGMRWTESFTYDGAAVLGKGNKWRNVFVPEFSGPDYTASYATFIRHLGRYGLNPHDLRKLALNRLVAAGADAFQLTQIAGWSSIATADSYIKTDATKLDQLMKTAMGSKQR